MLGLRWHVLDLDIGTLAVRESVFEGQFQPPKTQRAVRTIPLGPHSIAALTAHRQRVSRQAPTYLDDTQYKHLKGALDLWNGCGHPTGDQPDPVKLQAYYSDITQLVLLNPKFA